MYDVIVVGTGPAGATAARHTAKAGLKTLLLEKDRLPRIKTCGGGVSIQTVSNLGIDIPDSLIERRCFGVRVRYGDISLESEADECLVLMISRDRFDKYLTECAVDSGAQLMENVRVRSVDVRDDRVVVETTEGSFESNVVIGADGVHSVCAKNVRQDFDPEYLGFLLEAEIPVSNEFVDNYILDKCELHFGAVKSGYGWVFPKEEHLSVGIGSIGKGAEDPMVVYNNFIDKLGLDHVKPRGCFLPAGGLKRRTYADRILLAGDAAGYVDSFLGEGIAYAVRSGNLASEAVIEAHQNNDFSQQFFSSYQRKCEDDFGNNLKYSLIFARLFHRYPNVSARVLATNKPALDRFLHLVTGRFGYMDFMKWVTPRLPFYALKFFLGKH